MAFTAEAEETKLVVNHPKLARLVHPATEAGQRVVRNGATRQLLDPPAALADQMGVMPGELLSQLVPKAPVGRVDSPQEAHRHQKMDGPVHGDAIDAPLGHSIVDLLDRKRAIAGADGFQDGAARSGQAVTLSGE